MATFLNQVLDGSSCCECDSSRTSVCDPCGCPQTVCLEDNRPSGGGSSYFDYTGTYDQSGTYTSGGVTSIAYVRRSDGGAWIYKDWGIHSTYGYWTVGVNKGDTSSSTPNAVVQISTYSLNPCPNDYLAGSSIWDSALASNPGTVDDGDCYVGECYTAPPPFQYCGCEPSSGVSSNIPAPDSSQEYGNASGNPPGDVSVEYFYPGSGSPPVGGGSYDYGYFEWHDANQTYPCRYLADGTGSEPSGSALIWYDGTSGYWTFEETIGGTTDVFIMSEYYGGIWSTLYDCDQGPLTVSSGPNGGPTGYVNYGVGSPYYYIEVT